MGFYLKTAEKKPPVTVEPKEVEEKKEVESEKKEGQVSLFRRIIQIFSEGVPLHEKKLVN